jgi:hypothetical protein
VCCLAHQWLSSRSTIRRIDRAYAPRIHCSLNAPISAGDFRTLNRCLDDAIAGAVTEYGRERNQSGIDGESARGTERLGFFGHELRKLLNTALLASEVLKHSLVTRSLAEVRLTQEIQNQEPFRVAEPRPPLPAVVVLQS